MKIIIILIFCLTFFIFPIIKVKSQKELGIGIMGGMPTQKLKNYFPFSYGIQLKPMAFSYKYEVKETFHFLKPTSKFDFMLYNKKNAANLRDIDSSLYLANFLYTAGYELSFQYVTIKNLIIGLDAGVLINLLDNKARVLGAGKETKSYGNMSFCIIPNIAYQIGNFQIFEEYRFQINNSDYNSINIGIIFYLKRINISV